MTRRRRRNRRIQRTALTLGLLATAALPSHMSCSTVVRDAVTAGVSTFITEATTDLLTLWIRPLDLLLRYQGLSGGTTDSGTNGGDPFEPPPAQS